MVQQLLGYQMTDHACARCQQRGIREADLLAILYYGLVQRTHGCLRYVLTDRTLAHTPLEEAADRLRGLCIIVEPQTNLIVTVKHDYSIARNPGKLSRVHREMREHTLRH